MGFYVKGADAPKTCRDCGDLGYDIGCDLWEDYKGFAKSKHPDCPIVEVAEPHGRLIDENELGELIHRMWVSKQLTNTKYNTFNNILDIVKPVIEAEGE